MVMTCDIDCYRVGAVPDEYLYGFKGCAVLGF